MKTLFKIAGAAGCLAITLAACTNEIETVPQEEGTTLTSITATIGGDMTRLAYEDEGAGFIVKWKVGDAFHVYSEDPNSYVLAATSVEDDGKTATFTNNEGFSSTGTINAFFPAAKSEKEWADCHFNVQGQVIDADEPLAYLSDYNYMTAQPAVAEITASTITFTHQIAVLRFDLTVPADESITSINLSTQGAAGIAVTKNAADGTETKAKHLAATVKNAENELTAYLAVLPSTMEEQLALTVVTKKSDETKSVHSYIVEFDSEFEYKAGHIYRTTLNYTESAPGGGSYGAASILDNNTEVAVSFAQGDGSSDTPYLISSASELLLLNKLVMEKDGEAGKEFLLTTDIDIQVDVWSPIGYYIDNIYIDIPFAGKFDGGGHTISGKLVAEDTSGEDAFGLFAYTSGEVYNLHLAADVVGSRGQSIIGGITGVTAGKIYNCSVSGNVTSAYAPTGNASTVYIGGIVGMQLNDLLLEHCTMWGNISFDFSETTKAVGAGGILGNAAMAANVSWCINHGSITGTTGRDGLNSSIGGIISTSSHGTVKFCRNNGTIDVTSAAGSCIGGIAGVINIMHNCHNTSSTIGSQGGYIGKLAGISWDVNDDEQSIYDCNSSIDIPDMPYYTSNVGYVPVTELPACPAP